MRARSIGSTLAFALIAATGTAVHAQTDVAVSLYGAFNRTSSTSATSLPEEQNPADAAGALIELRHISSPLMGFEATYSYNRANQEYSRPPVGIDCFPNICVWSESVSANAHEITGDWLVSLKVANLRPFALAGLGLLVDAPGRATTYPYPGLASTSTSTQMVYVYGGGVDWGVLPHLGLRFQYRGNVYKAPQLAGAFSIDSFTHTAEPMIGAYFSF